MILFSASFDDALIARAERLGIDACLAKEQVAELPEVIHASVLALSAWARSARPAW